MAYKITDSCVACGTCIGECPTAADYEYGWKRLLNPEYGYSYSFYLFNVVGAEEYYNGQGSADEIGIKAVDDYTFEVTLKVADPTFQSKLVATPLYPTRQDVAEAAGDQWGKDWTKCVGKKIDKKDIFRYSDKSWAKIT